MDASQLLEDAFLSERPRLLRWMLSRTGDSTTAEDLVQEAYFEAWRNRHKLLDASGVAKWLNAITQNVYLRWQRQAVQRFAHESAWLEDDETLGDYALEQSELADLLDKALELLPPETRTVLLARYLEEQPQAKVARDMGISESALAVRLHRGKLALRKLLDSEADEGDDWQETRLWCLGCGQACYKAKFNSETGQLTLICPHCTTDPAFPAWGHNAHESLVGFKSIKPVHDRAKLLHFQRLSPALPIGHIPCHKCGRESRIIHAMPDTVPFKDWIGIHVLCDNCGVVDYSALSGIAGSSPQAIAHSKDNPRSRALPPQNLNYQGREAVKVCIESLHQNDLLELIFARDNYEILAVYRNGELDNES
jgi:RNA polymerase sigma factor (sigma-70 family)